MDEVAERGELGLEPGADVEQLACADLGDRGAHLAHRARLRRPGAGLDLGVEGVEPAGQGFELAREGADRAIEIDFRRHHAGAAAREPARGAIACRALDAVADLLDERAYVRDLEVFHRIGEERELRRIAGGDRARRAGRDHERGTRSLRSYQRGGFLARADPPHLDHLGLAEPFEQHPSDAAAVLVDDRQHVRGVAARARAVEACEREARDRDHDDRCHREEDEADAVAQQQAEVLRERGGENAHGDHSAPVVVSRSA